jgi:hypothetical protein
MAEGKSTFNDIADKLLLVLVLVLLLASSIYLLVMIRVERGKLEDGQVSLKPARPIAAKPIDVALYQGYINQVVDGIPVGSVTNRTVFNPERRVACVNPNCAKPIPWTAMVCPFCMMEQPEIKPEDNDQDEDGIPDAWEKEHGMDPYNPNDALMDPDGDGFTNREEYESKTDPADAESRPPFAAKLRITGTRQNLIDLTFWGTQQFSADELRFQLNSRKRGRSYFVVIGDEIEGYAVDRYLPDADDGVTLILTKDGNEYKLVKDEPFTFGDWTANLILVLNGRQFRGLKKGSEITVEEEQYIVVDISEQAVIIQNKATEEDLTVGRISPAEVRQLKARMGGGTLRRR